MTLAYNHDEIAARAYFIALEEGEATSSPTGCEPSASSRPLEHRALDTSFPTGRTPRSGAQDPARTLAPSAIVS